MNEYMCRNYVAGQIVNEMSLSKIKSRRLGGANKTGGQSGHVRLAAGNNLLEDEGSKHYKDWLAK